MWKILGQVADGRAPSRQVALAVSAMGIAPRRLIDLAVSAHAGNHSHVAWRWTGNLRRDQLTSNA